MRRYIRTKKRHSAEASEILGGKKKLVGIYTSGFFSFSIYERFYIYKPEEWAELIRLHAMENPGSTYVIIGNERADGPFTLEVNRLVREAGVDTIYAVGTPMGVTVEILQRLSYLIAFPSGIPIVANVLGIPTFMFYQSFLDKLRFSWPCPESLKNRTYKASIFCNPQEAIDIISGRRSDRATKTVAGARCTDSRIRIPRLASYFREGLVIRPGCVVWEELVGSGAFELMYGEVDGDSD